jgi:pimeloyl-ACP methyl ester carboxylesterase
MLFAWIKNLFARRPPPPHEKETAADEKKKADTCEPVFLKAAREGKEVVVFVHGLGGHFRDTWKKFPDLLDSDPDLPTMQILLAGYDATPAPWTNSIKSEGQRFVSNLRSLFIRDEELFLVGHSMGGLVILHGLVQELIDTRAEVAPANAVRHVTLYASPVFGAEIAAIVKAAAKLPILGEAVSTQLEDLAPGAFVNELISEVTDRIYSPTIAAGDASSKRKIQITACVGLKDLFVHPTSAKGVFKTPPPSYLDHDHFAVKEPESRTDLRYLPLKNMLEAHFIDWLDLWRAKLEAPATRRDAEAELKRRLRHALQDRLAARRDLNWLEMEPREREEWFLEYFAVAIDEGAARPGMRLGDILNLSLIAFLGEDTSRGR